MLCHPLLLVLLSIQPQLSSSQELQEPGCAAAAAAPALLQADQRRDAGVHRNLTEEVVKKHAPKLDDKKRKEIEEIKEEEEEKLNITKEAVVGSSPVVMPPGSWEKDYSFMPKTKPSQSSTGTPTMPSQATPTMPSYADIDANEDGVLTPSEFQKTRGKVIVNIEKQVKQVIEHEEQIETAKLGLEREIDEMPAYEDLDRNHDGVLIPAEYTNSSVTSMARNLSYKDLDPDGDGAVTPGDFKDASEKWVAEVREQVEEKVAEHAKAREERRKLEQDIDSIQSYKDLDKQRDGVITRAEYGEQVNAAHGTWGVEHPASAKEAPGAQKAGANSAAKEGPQVQKAGANSIAKEAHQVQKAGSMATGLGFACLAVLVQAF